MKKLILVISCLFIFNNSAVALVEVDITRGNLDPLPIAVSPLYIESGSKDIKYNDTIIISNTFQSGADFSYGDIQPFYILN